jgi:6-phosphogluconolactonase
MIRGISPDGTLSADPIMLHHDGRGPNSKRQENAHPHGATFSPDGEFLYVPDLGIDRVMAYRYSAENGGFEKMEGAGFRSRPGAGPRHLTFGTNGRFAYLVNELDNTVLSMRYTGESGKLEGISTLSSLPANFAGENTAAEIQVGPDGRNLYVSNRGYDSIAVFKLFPDGTMSLAGHKTGGIRKPRHFGLSPDGRICLVSNEDGGDIAAFELDLVSGMLGNQLFSVRIDKPVCAKFAVPRA